jgi:hypothetical protein
MSDQPVAKASTRQHRILTRDISMPPHGIRIRSPSTQDAEPNALDRPATAISEALRTPSLIPRQFKLTQCTTNIYITCSKLDQASRFFSFLRKPLMMISTSRNMQHAVRQLPPSNNFGSEWGLSCVLGTTHHTDCPYPTAQNLHTTGTRFLQTPRQNSLKLPTRC